MTGEMIYRNFHDGPGPDKLVGLAVVVQEVASGYEARAQQIRALMGRMEAAWQGDAAGAARRGAGPLAVEHELSGLALGTAQDLTNRQAGSFSEARSRVVPVPPKPELLNPVVAFTDPVAVVDHERQVDEYNAAAQHNVDVMNGYSGATEYNTTNLPTSYGMLSDDRAGLGVGPGGTTIDSDDFGGGSSAGWDGGRAAGPDSGRDTGSAPSNGNRSPVSGPEQAGPGTTGGPTAGGEGQQPAPGATAPATVDPRLPGHYLPPGESGAGRVPNAPPAAGPLTGAGAAVPYPGTGGGLGRSPRGGGPGGAGGPFGGGAGPRGGGGPGAGAEPHGSSPRTAPATGVTAGAGRTPAAGGFPMGAAGQGRNAEDTERKRPEWLEGGDPDELFDTDVLTAPPTIGAEDD